MAALVAGGNLDVVDFVAFYVAEHELRRCGGGGDKSVLGNATLAAVVGNGLECASLIVNGWELGKAAVGIDGFTAKTAAI